MFGQEFLSVVGLYALTYYLYDNLRSPLMFVYSICLRSHKRQQLYLKGKYGEWAAITGSTDGIGKAYARELARLGFNIVLISRTEEKLKDVAQEIEMEFHVETFIIQCDFSKGAEVYNNLFNSLSEKPIGILINNVGIGHDPGPLGSFSPQHIWDVININIGAATQLSRHFVNKWYKSQSQGLIVNISSGTELQPCPFGSIYGGSKAFLRSFTHALQEETKNTGITVQLCSPNFVVTKINSYSKIIMKGGNVFLPQPEEYAKWAVGTLGRLDETSGYYWHGIQNAFWKLLPYRLRRFVFISAAKVIIDKKQ